MEHLIEAELQAWIDGELDPAGHARVSRHLEACGDCRRLASELRSAAETFTSAMLAYDEDLAATDGRAISRPSYAGVRSATIARFLPRWAGRAAAVVLLLGAAAAAAMVPGSPLRNLIVGPPTESVAPPPAETVPATTSAVVAGASITMRPLEGRLTVRIAGFAAGTRVSVALTDREDVIASLPDGASDARFVVASGTLDVVGAGAPAGSLDGAVNVRLPRSLRVGVVELDGTAVARVTDGRLITLRQVSRTGDQAVFEVGG